MSNARALLLSHALCYVAGRRAVVGGAAGHCLGKSLLVLVVLVQGEEDAPSSKPRGVLEA